MTEPSSPSQPTTFLPMDTQAAFYKWLVAAIVILAASTQTFAGNSVNLAIPRLMAAFGSNLAATQWVTAGFLITRTLIIPVLGWLGAFLGNRNLFVICLLGFVATSIGCGLATSLPMLIGFRLLQGLILGPIEGLTAVLLVQVFPPHQRGLALGMRAVGSSLGHVISFTLGGYFLEQVSWRLIFFMGVPFSLIAATSGFLVLPQQREYKGEPIDYPGLLLLGAFLIPLLLLISFGRDNETAGSTMFWLGGCALSGGGLFIGRELLTAFPAINLRLFRRPAFCRVCATAFFNNMGLFGAQFMLPIFLQQVIGLTPLQAGAVIVPAIICSGLSGVVTGKLSDVFHPALVVLGALAGLIAVFYVFSSITPTTAIGVMVAYIIVYRSCIFAINNPLTALNAQILGTGQLRMGQGLLGVTRNIGAALGVTVTSVVFERQRAAHQLMGYQQYNEGSPTHAALIDDVQYFLHQAGITGGTADQAALRAIQRQLDVEAIASGFRDSFLFVCLCYFVAALPMIWTLYQHLQRAKSP